MKLMDKIKNALFEEEYVEIEEIPKKKKEKKPKRKVEPFEDMEEERTRVEPIAKRIVPPEKKAVSEKTKEVPITKTREEVVSKSIASKYEDSIVTLPVREEKKFTMVTDDDLKPDNEVVHSKVSSVEVKSTKLYSSSKYDDISIKEVKAEKVEREPYQAGKKGNVYLDNYTVHEYGSKTKEKTYFKPSPIISPIYGIIEDTDKKEEYNQPREIRLSSSYRDKADLDDIRKKAFGGLVDDIGKFDAPVDDVYSETVNDDDNLLVDLRDDKSIVEVEKVTVGDAVEYFEDLGLEYNNDYIDATKEKANGRRVKTDSEYDQMPVGFSAEEDDSGKPSFLKQKNEQKSEKTDEENLFDLIDSMYDK
ncbi:MAG: hypothetical protein J6B89_05115 [Bacilli bacterium]|nr:hypothetical protein [Bacilli bacterium]